MPVIVLSGEPSDGLLKRARELGANEALVKSAFSAQHLLASIRRHLEVTNHGTFWHEGASEKGSCTD